MRLFPYQKTGAAWLVERETALLADGMGLGKTPQAIAAADIVGARRVAVICPAIARVNWQRELHRWGRLEREVYIESYNRVGSRGEAYKTIKAMRPDLLILDEAHYLKSRTSKRTTAIYGQHCHGKGLIEHAERVWLLTGTPAPNDVSELYTHMRALWPELLPGAKTYDAYIRRYTHFDVTPYGVKVFGNKNVKELKQALAPVMLRRRGEDVLADLPPISWHDVAIEVKDVAIDEGQPEVRQLLYALEHDLPLPDTLELASVRRMTGIAKAKAIADMLSEELKDKAYPKVIVFAHHKDVIAKIAEVLAPFGPVVITGETAPAARQEAIDRFQSDTDCRVFVGNIQACSTAVTLHAADQVVFAEASWTPSDNAQAAKRAHRIGQTRPVRVRMIGLAGSIDEAVTRVLARKSQLISQVLEDAA